MANIALFQTWRGRLLPATNALNHEGAPAYAFSARHALAELAVTGCLNATFYASASAQLDDVLRVCRGVDAAFIAKTAVYARAKGFMKDVPALLCATLAVGAPDLLKRVFARVLDNGKMLRNFVQILRSGAVGRKSLGTVAKRLIRAWLDARSDAELVWASVGRRPTLADIIRMVHPRPANERRRALYGYLLARPYDQAALPALLVAYERFKRGMSSQVPDVPFELLAGLHLTASNWQELARQASWQTMRMNLRTFERHGVFENSGVVAQLATRLRDPEVIARARVLPYQLLVTYRQADPSVPVEIRAALQDALEVATRNVPAIAGKVYVCPDVSGSMGMPVTGHRNGATTVVRCSDVAALVAASVLRRNPTAEVIPFEDTVLSVRLNPRDSVMTNADKLAAIGGGGTDCSAPLALLNARRARADLVIFVSDNQSWVDARRGPTQMMHEWSLLRHRNPNARLVCVDIQPYGTTQVAERDDILNVGGFSDQVFEVIAEFAAGRLSTEHWVGAIEAVEL